MGWPLFSARAPEPERKEWLAAPALPAADANAARETDLEDLLDLIWRLEDWERRLQPTIRPSLKEGDMAKTENVDLGDAGSFTVHKGALHRALGIPEGQTIPASRLNAASNSSDPRVRRMAASAKGFKAMGRARTK